MSQDIDVVLLTESRYEHPTDVDWYVGNVLSEDRLLREQLEFRGLRVERVDWARGDFDWARARAAVFRSTWDYFHRFAEFSAWLERVAPLTELINPAPLIRWNWDKHYLLDLEARGVHCVPTTMIEAGHPGSLAEHFALLGCEEAILKPAIGGAGRHTYRLSRANLAEHQDVFREVVRAEAMLLQPFQQSVLSAGEVSLIVIAGRCTHAVRKIGKPGDFRVHDDYGGTVHPHAATGEETEFAERAVAACPHPPAYARVDLVRDNDGRLAIMELELIEPELFFRFQPAAAERLAEVITSRLERQSAEAHRRHS